MLHSLSVSNYILIGSLDISFPEGLVIISGETGAGKSILLGALSLVLGAKSDAGMVGPHGENCVVEAEFGLDDEIRSLLEQADLPAEGDCLLLRRTVAKSGRSRSFANDEPVSVNVLQELATRLVDIHSQHQTLRLGDERFRREALDLWAGCIPLREECTRAWAQLGESRRELSRLEERLTHAREEQEYNNARWERLNRARLVPGELEDLENEQKQLAHAEEIKELLYGAQAVLEELHLKDASKLLDKGSAFIPSLESLGARLESARLELEDIAAEVESLNSRTEASPERLEAVEERLSLLYGLLQKHGVGSLEELMDERDRLESLVLDATTLVSEVEQARKTVRENNQLHESLCVKLHEAREKAAPGFAAAVQEQLRFLELDRAVFQIGLEPCAAGADGSDNVRFLFSAEGRTPSDVSKTASGGELSRIMLSLKAVMARFKRLPTLVFDEIDTGVSGSAADKMGSLVCTMGTQMQVFAITHLPQVAAKGNAHYLVSKEDGVTSVRSLDAEGRVQELARMLSGATITPAAIANAQALLQS